MYVLWCKIALKIRQSNIPARELPKIKTKEGKIMATIFSIAIVVEILLTAFIAWGIMNEEKLVDFEDKIIFAILKKIRRRRADKRSGR